MKIFSLPVLLIGAAVVVVGGGIIYALSTSSHRAASVPAAVASPASPAPVAATDATAPSTGSEPASAPVASTDSGGGQPEANAMTPSGNSGQAGGNREKHHGNGQRMQQMMAQLGLSADQQQQIQQIRATITDRQERRDAIMKVLTPDQQAKFQELRTQMRAQFGNGRGGGQTPVASQTPATGGQSPAAGGQ